MERMEWLNYHHLLYFFVVAREGGLAPAGRVLHVTHSTLSAQLRALEDRLGHRLFTRVGRRLELTDAGRAVYEYAAQIFSLGQELLGAMRGPVVDRPWRLRVGVVDVLPKLVVRRVLAPALRDEPHLRLVCREATLEHLLADLSVNALDLVLSDVQVPAGRAIRATAHFLGETRVTFFAVPALARPLRRGFPRSLHGAPMVLPLEDQPLRRALDDWFTRHRLTPRVIAEVEDSALLKVFGAEGLGVFPSPTLLAREIGDQYGVEPVGPARDVRQAFFALAAERQHAHPAVARVVEAARRALDEGARRTRRSATADAPG